MTKDKMKAIVAQGYGSPDILKLENVDKPEPKSNEVLIKVHASSVTKADTMIRTGKPYFGRLITGLFKPKHPIPGTGFSGEVVQIGSDVNKFQVGEEVFGETTIGFSANAEYLVIQEDGVILHKPENLSHADATSFTDGHLTSYIFLTELANIRKGQKVLINGASGSLGTAAVQIAKYFGAEVTGVSSTTNVGLVRSLGADHIIDYTKFDFTKSNERYDIIFDTIGKSSFSKAKKVLTNNGIYISPVLDLGLLIQMMITSKIGTKKAKFTAAGLKSESELRSNLEKVVEIYKAGKLKTVIDRQYPLEKVADAHEYIDKGHKKGNITILINSK
jgi:NADPH:quinone reductase-like Zn-dependent oxidoreductase